MANDIKNIDLLQKFIENEKKAKLWTLMSVVLFCLLAFGVVYLAWKLAAAQKSISAQSETIIELNKKLETALAKADSLNEVLLSENKSLENRKTNYDSLQNITSSLLINLSEIKQTHPEIYTENQTTNQLDKPTQAKIELLLTPANIEKMVDKVDKYTIYIQYATGFEDDAKNLRRGWQENYVCPKPELITDRNFAAAVNYFHPEDEAEAKKVAAAVEGKIGLPIKVTQVNMKSPKKQLELWLGKYQAKTRTQILQKYEISNELIQKSKRIQKMQRMPLKIKE
jgi:flagellar biosynthesis/type III secretory pathway chaperone